jgi:coproporphyrinogen III oxidase
LDVGQHFFICLFCQVRGVGGIFFDDLTGRRDSDLGGSSGDSRGDYSDSETGVSKDKEERSSSSEQQQQQLLGCACQNFSEAVADTWLRSWLPICRKVKWCQKRWAFEGPGG